MPSGVLVCGVARSGTTLTRACVGRHPAFAMSPLEMVWWVTLYPRYRGRPAQWDAFLADLARDAKTRALGVDPERLTAALAAVPRGAHLQAFARVLETYAVDQRRPRWGDKTLYAEVFADDILAALPDLRMVHLIRDPRDVYVSYLHAPWRVAVRGRWARAKIRVHGHLAWVLRNWRTSVRLARAHAARYPDRYRVLRYEDLVRDPEGELRALCAFLGEAYDARMLAGGSGGDGDAVGGNTSFEPLIGVSTAPIGRFASRLPPRAIAMCERLAGDELAANGYAPAGLTLDARDALALHLADRPVAAGIAAVHAAAFRLSGRPR